MKATPYLRLLLILLSALIITGCARIKPDEIGVRTLNLGPGKGIVQKDYGPGYHRYLWPLDSWHRFPRTAQRIRFTRDAIGIGEEVTQRFEPLIVTSADGDRVTIDAEVFFRVQDDAAHKVLQDSGPGERYREVVRTLSLDAARGLFGQLRTEEFYNPARREELRREAVTLLQERLSARGIELIDILLPKIQFDPNYENLIKQKKVADQRVELERSKALAAEERGKVDVIRTQTQSRIQTIEREAEAKITQIRTETDMQIAAIKAESNKYSTQRRADADLYRSQREAEGQLMIRRAEAEGTQRMNEALSGEGGKNLAALEAVKNLQLTDVTFPSIGYEWFNPVNMAIRLGAEDKARTGTR